MLVVIFLLIVSFIALFFFGLSQEQKLIKIFEDNDFILDKETILQNSTGFVDSFEITLLNLGVLLSYRGEYQSILFKNKFFIECYESFDILTLNTYTSSYSIKIPKYASSIKNDIFVGRILKINVQGLNLLFRLPNEMQSSIYKRYK